MHRLQRMRTYLFSKRSHPTPYSCSNLFVLDTYIQSRGTSGSGREDEISGAERLISVDRTGLFESLKSQSTIVRKEPETQITRILKSLIKEALTNSTAGYYTQRDVFGSRGDFITSPEISQLFGEMVGVWCAHMWSLLHCPKKLLIVELGPGRGTLMADLMRGTSPLKGFTSAIEIHLIEVSDKLRSVQQSALKCDGHVGSQAGTASAQSTINGAKVFWHRSLEEVPDHAPAIFIAHEFFDALPAHQFQRTDRGWRERLIDVAPDDFPFHFRMVLAPGATPASKLLLKRQLDSLPPQQQDSMTELEISPQTMTTAQELARRIEQQDGAALIMDYGKDSPQASSLQAVKEHKVAHFLASPGEADLSCRVDFSAIRQGVLDSKANVTASALLPQAHFLAGLGMEARLDKLLEGAAEADQNSLISGYNRLLSLEEEEESGPGLEHPALKGSSEKTSHAQQSLDGSLPAGRSELDEQPGMGGQKQEIEDDGLEGIGVSEQHAAGMGMAYKAMAIFRSGQTPPIPFPGSGITFE